jgi:hypothetical protein
MTMKVAVGQAFSVEGREAVSKAIYDARLELDNAPVSFAFIIVSIEYDFHEISVAAKSQLGEVPVIGFSTSSEISSEGSQSRSVVVALISDENLEARSEWLPGFSESSHLIAEQVMQTLQIEDEEQGVLLMVADGFEGDYEELLRRLPAGKYSVVGCLAGGDLQLGRSYQMGGERFGHSGLAAAFLSSETLQLGVGIGHGWEAVGANFRVTHSRDMWVRSLDGRPASDGYANLFGRSARDWAFPPLNTLVRLYPLGIERENLPLQVRTPMRVEADGSLRMSASLRDGSTGHLLVGSREKCLEAARKATSDALGALGDARPKLAMVFADVSWELLFQGYAGAEVEAIREVLGPNVPIIGGYTFGQFAQPNGAPLPEFLNQHVEVVVLGDS